MKKHKKFHFKTYLEKVKFKYKVSILNENTLEETFHIRLSRLNVFLMACSILFIVFIINSLLIGITPLKHFLPGYESSERRSELVSNAIVIDSISGAVKAQDQYIELLRNIVAGNIKPEEIKKLDSTALKKREELLAGKTKNEKEYCEDWEKEEKYNLSVLNSTQKNQKEFVFFKPAKGSISEKFNPKKLNYGIHINTAPNQNIVSVLDGTVINTGFTIDEGYVITIQHANEFISIYKNNSQLLKSIGSTVKAGESIAISGNTGEKTASPYLHFELWQKGKPVNPEEYIIF